MISGFFKLLLGYLFSKAVKTDMISNKKLHIRDQNDFEVSVPACLRMSPCCCFSNIRMGFRTVHFLKFE